MPTDGASPQVRQRPRLTLLSSVAQWTPHSGPTLQCPLLRGLLSCGWSHAPLDFYGPALPHLTLKCCLLPFPCQSGHCSTLGLLELLIGNPQTSYTFPRLCPGLTPQWPGLPSLLSFSFWRGSRCLLSEKRSSPFSGSPSPAPRFLPVGTVVLMVLVSLSAHSSLLL